MKPIILLDMDDTLCHLVRRVVSDHNEKYPTHLVDFAEVGWDLQGLMHPECKLDDLFKRPGLYEELELLDEYVLDEVFKLHTVYELIIVTASWPQSVPEKWNWLQRHMPFIPQENFIMAKKKYLVQGDVLIDDAPHNLTDFISRGRKVIGIRQPWNRQLWDDSRIYWVDGWKDMTGDVRRVLTDAKLQNTELEDLLKEG